MVPRIELNDYNTIPQLGFGTFVVDPTEAERVVTDALEVGYRHIDTAAAYGNEEGVGRAIAKSGIPREELFITTKLWNDRHEDADAALNESLERLGLDYVDMYLIHWPVPSRNKYVEAWKSMIGQREAGLVKSIGVCNFMPAHLDRLEMESNVTPVVNQIELHPWLQQWKDLDAAKMHSIAIEAWAPLAKFEYDFEDYPEIMDPAEAHGVTPAQVVLRWHIQNGTIIFPKTTHRERMEENFDIFGFELTRAEMEGIISLDEGEFGRLGSHPNDKE